jgi:GTP cyclohydrolase II
MIVALLIVQYPLGWFIPHIHRGMTPDRRHRRDASRAAAFRLADWRLLGSRRCDRGEQLRLALAPLQELGVGIILYLTREGRGLGLANKMRTYQLQDEDLDTFDANTTLGFDDDERDYGIVARMLRMLNSTRTVLLQQSG